MRHCGTHLTMELKCRPKRLIRIGSPNKTTAYKTPTFPHGSSTGPNIFLPN